MSGCEQQSGFSLLLLTCIERASMDVTVRTAASITFKNMVKRRWESEDVISSQDRAQVKAHIIQVRF